MNILQIESITFQELVEQFEKIHSRIDSLEKRLSIDERNEYTLSEVAKLKGYNNKGWVKRLIIENSIPFFYKGKEVCISRDDIKKIKPKSTFLKQPNGGR